jgi:hypothetical protein
MYNCYNTHARILTNPAHCSRSRLVQCTYACVLTTRREDVPGARAHNTYNMVRGRKENGRLKKKKQIK